MSLGWETTTEDVQTVLNRHGIQVSEERLSEIHDLLDFDAIESGVYFYTAIESQTDSMLCDIEDQLIDEGIIPKGTKHFFNPEADDDFEDDEDDWDEDEDEFEDDDSDVLWEDDDLHQHPDEEHGGES